MNWTPEIFGGFVTAGGASLYLLKRLGILNLDWTRNKPNNPGNFIVHELRSDCKSAHEGFRTAIDQLEDNRTELKTKIEFHKERMDKQDVLIDKIFDKVDKTNTNVTTLLERTKAQG